ncbi:MAG: hypothetical protein ACRDBM_12735 [Sporomusa sp.]
MAKITNSELADKILENPKIAIKMNRKDLMKKLSLSRKPEDEDRDCDAEELVQTCVDRILEEFEGRGQED